MHSGLLGQFLPFVDLSFQYALLTPAFLEKVDVGKALCPASHNANACAKALQQPQANNVLQPERPRSGHEDLGGDWDSNSPVKLAGRF